MSKATSVLFGIEDEFDVFGVDSDRSRAGQDHHRDAVGRGGLPGLRGDQRAGEGPAAAADQGLASLRPAGQLWWRKRRLACLEALCPRRSFTQPSVAIRPRGRLTERLRARVAEAIAAGNRAVSEVAAEYGVSWPTAHQALVAAAARWLPEPTPTAGWGSMRPGSGRFAGCSTGSPGYGRIRG